MSFQDNNKKIVKYPMNEFSKFINSSKAYQLYLLILNL